MKPVLLKQNLTALQRKIFKRKHITSVDCALDVKIDGWSLRNMKKNISLAMSMAVSGSEAKVQSVKALAYISYRNCVKLLSLVVNTVLI